MTTEQVLKADRQAIAKDVFAYAQYLERSHVPIDGDVRLQFFGYRWFIHTGDASYDQDHRGFWGSSSVSATETFLDCLSIVDDLIEQVLEHEAEFNEDSVI